MVFLQYRCDSQTLGGNISKLFSAAENPTADWSKDCLEVPYCTSACLLKLCFEFLEKLWVVISDLWNLFTDAWKTIMHSVHQLWRQLGLVHIILWYTWGWKKNTHFQFLCIIPDKNRITLSWEFMCMLCGYVQNVKQHFVFVKWRVKNVLSVGITVELSAKNNEFLLLQFRFLLCTPSATLNALCEPALA